METRLLWILGALLNTWNLATQTLRRFSEARKARNSVPLACLVVNDNAGLACAGSKLFGIPSSAEPVVLLSCR